MPDPASTQVPPLPPLEAGPPAEATDSVPGLKFNTSEELRNLSESTGSTQFVAPDNSNSSHWQPPEAPPQPALPSEPEHTTQEITEPQNANASELISPDDALEERTRQPYMGSVDRTKDNSKIVAQTDDLEVPKVGAE